MWNKEERKQIREAGSFPCLHFNDANGAQIEMRVDEATIEILMRTASMPMGVWHFIHLDDATMEGMLERLAIFLGYKLEKSKHGPM